MQLHTQQRWAPASMSKNVELLNFSPSAPGWDSNVIMRKSETTIKFCTNFVNNTVTAGEKKSQKKKNQQTPKSMYKLLLSIMLDSCLGASLIAELGTTSGSCRGGTAHPTET